MRARHLLLQAGCGLDHTQVTPVSLCRSLAEVDNGKLLGFGADLAADHPGFADPAYKQRRTQIAQLAAQHRVCDPCLPANIVQLMNHSLYT